MRPMVVDDSRFLDALLLREIVDAGVAPAAVAAVATLTEAGWLAAFGAAGRVGSAPTTVDTPFDLASVTKPLFALSCARLVERGRLAWSAPASAYLPLIADTPAGERTLAEHLSHRAGLRAHVELFAPLREGRPLDIDRAYRTAAQSVRTGPDAEAPLDGSHCSSPLYSDLGYLLVGRAVEEVTGRPLDEVLLGELREVCGEEQLGSSRQWRRRDPTFTERVAPTENVPWRGGTLRGVVHDDNAWALSGYGCSGHAGLFGSAPALLRFGVALLETLGPDPARRPLVRRSTLEELLRPRPGGSLRLGFDGKEDERSMAGRVAGPNTFGHLGYTGTSFWCDPDARTVTILLTNRVHPTAGNLRIRQARPRVHDELFQLAWNCRMPSRTANAMLPLVNPAGGSQLGEHQASRPDRCGS